MKELLKNYIDKSDPTYCNDVVIDYYDIRGVDCYVTFYDSIHKDHSEHYKEEMIIDIWDMIEFLQNKKQYK